jgi:MFS family permease
MVKRLDSRSMTEGRQRSDLWHHRDFLKLWSGETVSLVGDQFFGLAFLLTAVLVLHASASQMGVLQALGNLPFLLLGLVAGVWADRYVRVGWLIVLSAASFSVGSLLMVLARSPYGVYFLIVAFFIVSFGAVVYNVNQVSYRQALVPLRLQGGSTQPCASPSRGSSPSARSSAESSGRSSGSTPPSR